ncbi:MAG: zinc ribbon domain-containing protein [Blastocatellia bacterium]|nr:zinc ribbon domain-containing protein [Blastocatellia bacterium]MCS7156977.1 zinc ribbon domain-containing protein [Blastocatellia bacterium]MCX7752178.1 zinc ribbon domain-containing protein [Blastocatellia bacterium]MDW8167670.1 zinc ribbon domain-containing protein [Acidobacteriota bacterium]MDW8256269.1 zinc ribbon domain-containing protein [Acidobacteriota bacterium]
MDLRLRATVISSRFGFDSVECDVKVVLPGTIESLRPRLATALEKMGYHVVSEDPLQARRGGVNFALNVLKYPISLQLGFKSVGEQTTQVTFSYLLKHSGLGWITKGDLPVLMREAEAVAAIALRGRHAPLCGRCGSENPMGSRFCRRCGAPLTALEPAEVEVLRLVAENQAAYRAILWGIACLAVTTLGLVALPFDLPVKLERFLAGLGILAGASGWGPLLWGVYKLRRNLGRRGEEEEPLEPHAIEVPPAAAFPTSGMPFSVTEETTQLLEEPSSLASASEGTTQLLERTASPPSQTQERETS